MTNGTESIERFMAGLRRRNPGEDAYAEAVAEVIEDVHAVAASHDGYRAQEILRRIAEPDRVVSFRVVWQDDKARVRVERGWRVQHSNAIGPYKGGLRFHPDVDESVFKALAFEQTFKNALTGLPMGGAKGGATFEPKGKSDLEVMRFCQAFMAELHHHIGPDIDVPAGDIGVGAREIGYMFGEYKRITGRFVGALTGKGLDYGGSPLRTEATGYGAVIFLQAMLERLKRPIAEVTVALSGSGNVALHAAEKLIALGAKVLTLSDSGGFVHDPDGIDADKLGWIRTLKLERRGRIADYADHVAGARFHQSKRPWSVAADIAMPCATQHEIDNDDAAAIAASGALAVVEGSNMAVTATARRRLAEARVLHAPGKAANAGGVAVSGLEMAQNSGRRSWERDAVEDMLDRIMRDIHATCVADARDDGYVDYMGGANRAGFRKVADAMLAFGAT